MDLEDLIARVRRIAFTKRCPTLRVFISSTFKDLKKERQAVQRAVNLCGCFARLAEEADLQPGKSLIDQIPYWLRDIDLVIVLICERYGELGPSQVSWTEEEVKKTVELEKLMFPYFIQIEIPDGIELDKRQRKRLERFKSWLTKLENQQPPQYLQNIEELVIRVVRDVAALQSDHRIAAVVEEILSEKRREREARMDSYNESFLG